MKERPILFTGPMVNAILEGKKTQTRRIIKKNAPHESDGIFEWYPGGVKAGFHAYNGRSSKFEVPSGWAADWCRYGAPGDRLWIRESWRALNRFNSFKPRDIKKSMVAYSVDQATGDYRPAPIGRMGKVRPGIFMPRWASRIILEVTAIRCERIQDITASDIDAEGLSQSFVLNMICEAAAKHKTKPLHWIHGADEGIDWCPECGAEEASRLQLAKPDDEIFLDGGWGTESDGNESCEGCSCPLENTLTNYGCKAELDHFEEYGFDHDAPSDCYSLERILETSGWDDNEISEKTKRLSYSALWNKINGRESWASNPWVWVVEFRKVEEHG